MPVNDLAGYGQFTRDAEQLDKEILYSTVGLIQKGGILRQGEGVLEAGTVLAIDPATGKWLAYDNTAAVNEVQTLTETGTITAGTFDYTIPALDDAVLTVAFDDTAAEINAKLDALCAAASPPLPAGTIVATGGAIDTAPVVLTYTGALGSRDVGLGTVDNTDLVGGTVAASQTTAGVAGGATAVAILRRGADATLADQAINVCFAGTFKTAALVGLDANAITDLGATQNTQYGWTHIP